MRNEVKKLSDLIIEYSDKLRLFKQINVPDIYSSWAAIVGEKQASHSRLIDIKHQIAIIETDHSGWSQQILLNKRYIIRNFQKKYPQLEVKNISVIVSSYYHIDPCYLQKSNSDSLRQQEAEKEINQEIVQREKIIESADNIKKELPAEVQEAFERLKLSIVNRNG